MKTKAILAFLIAIALILPACSADGGLIVPPHIWGSIQETQQVAVMDIDMDKGVVETSLFISLQDLTDESHTVRWVIPLEEMPDDFNIVKMTFGDYMNKHDIYDKRWSFEELDYATENIMYSYEDGLQYVLCIFNSNACRYYYPRPMLYGGYKGIAEMATVDAINPTQITYYGSTLLEVFNTTSDTSLDALFQQVGVSDELAAKYDRYKGKYFYITFMQTEPLLEGESEITTYCPRTYQDILNYIQSQSGDDEWYGGYWSTMDMYTDQCIREADVKGNWTDEEYVRNLIWELFDRVVYSHEGDITGIEVSFTTSITEGDELYYPLGTGDMWSKPIGNIEIYAELPEDYAIAHDERIFNEDTKIYRWQYEEENPTEDILLEVEEKSESAARTKQKVFFWFAEFGYTIPVLLFILSWIIVGIFVMRPEKKFEWKKAFNFDSISKAFLLFAIFFIPTYAASSMLVSIYSYGAPLLGFAAMWYYLKNFKKEKKEESYKKPAKIIAGTIVLFFILYYVIKYLLELII